MADYLNDMEQLEAEEVMVEWNDDETLKLAATNGTFTVINEVRAAIFIEVIEQRVPVGWAPTCREVSYALVRVMQFQLEIYRHHLDTLKADRSMLQSLAVLIAKDYHFFFSPEGMNQDQQPLDYQPMNVIQRLFRRVGAEYLIELLYGRRICSQRYMNARRVLIDEVSNLVVMVLSLTTRRPQLDVTWKEELGSSKWLTSGYWSYDAKRLCPRPQLDIDESQLLLTSPSILLEHTKQKHHFVTNFAGLITTELLKQTLGSIDYE